MKTILIPLLLLISACTHAADPQPARSDAAIAGYLENADINEASGLARSHLNPERYWVINDSDSSPRLYAIGNDGSHQAVVEVEGAAVSDWEDLSSYVIDDRAMLLIADVGDNLARRRDIALYIVAEPALAGPDPHTIEVIRQINVILPDGATDVESVSVDTVGEKILILSKRDIPAVLYEVPLWADEADGPVKATRLGVVDSIVQPTARDRAHAPVALDWHWQPTAMDISPDGRNAVILTYRALYFYQRSPAQSWFDALQLPPATTVHFDAKEAEAVAFSVDGTEVYVTIEQINAPLLRFNLVAR